MKIALAAARFINGNVAFNLSQMEGYMRKARTQGAELVCFGESFLQGFDGLTWNYEQDKDIACTLDSPELTDMKRWSAEIGIDVLFGFIERKAETLFSTCVLVSCGEILHKYRRISPGWKEQEADSHYWEGNSSEPFLYKGRTCAIALCGDLWVYPERFRGTADVLFWPIFVNFSVEEWQKTELSDYAEHAGTISPHVLLINSVTGGEAPAFGGCAHFRNGTVSASLPMGEEGILITEIP
ncbi:MAG: carbon-nitrogen hydrolase family protein [Eubacteriales bacterium]|nr:carbon-nitrogen hydrolase family protein [Eubacteriales bacterium]